MLYVIQYTLFNLNNVFTTKANTLQFLQQKLQKSKIEKLYSFTIRDWEKNSSDIINHIAKNFDSKKIIIRSSAIGEDSIETSQAGTYESVLNVSSRSKTQIKKAIMIVIQSYRKKNNDDLSNQVLIQHQSDEIISSGVVFTKIPETGSSYYVINYEKGNSTTGVTKGLVNETIKIFKKTPLHKIPIEWRSLITSIKEIESVLQNSSLDIEFGITKKNIVIFQVRPMTSVIHPSTKEDDVEKLLSNIKKYFSKLNSKKHTHGNHTIFSDMSDWNPSEIIGNSPNKLDYSLYDLLIMKDVWHKGRTILGYTNVNPYPLMVKFGNKPYVDIRGSFNSLIPDKLDRSLKQKLINFYFKKLEQYPYLHDKVEFEILFTCYDLTVDARLKELTKFGFSKDECKQIKKSLLDFTNNIIHEYPTLSKKCQMSINELSKQRNKIKSQLSKKERTYTNLLSSAEKLLMDCRKLGTIPFSTMARMAFISSAILKSAEKTGYVTNHFINDFMNLIITPLSEIQDDLIAYSEKKISKKQFLKKYGHLRPGTYDITAPRYDAQKDFFTNIKFHKRTKPKIKRSKNYLNDILSENGLLFDTIDFLTFVKDTLVKREQLKFEFTKNLSDALELIAEAGYELGFSRNQMANLSINDIISNKTKDKSYVQSRWKNMILQEEKIKSLRSSLILPPLIFSLNDFEIIRFYASKPNFITNKKIISNVFFIKKSEENPSQLENKIVVIENADPGYDWIFTRNPAGLITKYGGIASHMAIRCSETGLPAAIGCGDILYEKLLHASKILLDCHNKEIFILENIVVDETIEARKVLKSLGYIR